MTQPRANLFDHTYITSMMMKDLLGSPPKDEKPQCMPLSEFLQCLLRLNACQERGVRLSDCRGVDLCSETAAVEVDDDDDLLEGGSSNDESLGTRKSSSTCFASLYVLYRVVHLV